MKKVLVIDDDEGSVKFLSTILVEGGYGVASAAHGVEGMDKAKAEIPDLIILDVMMPKRSGFVLFRQLKKEETLKGIPVIMLTGVADSIADAEDETRKDTLAEMRDSIIPKLKDKVKEFRSDGEVRPEAFLDKPVEPEALIGLVKKLIG